MSRILTATISALMLTGCADTYNKSIMPHAAANLQQATVGCKARWTAKEFKTYSEWQACQLTAESGFARTIALTKMDAFEVYAADMKALAADRDAHRVTDRQVRSRANEILDTFLADCGCRPKTALVGFPADYGPRPTPVGFFSAAPNAGQHSPLP
ncbi:MAG: hypothetical protein V4601_06385 [Pseudomonadota bacterium]